MAGAKKQPRRPAALDKISDLRAVVERLYWLPLPTDGDAEMSDRAWRQAQILVEDVASALRRARPAVRATAKRVRERFQKVCRHDGERRAVEVWERHGGVRLVTVEKCAACNLEMAREVDDRPAGASEVG
jgi:hypothetical protein